MDDNYLQQATEKFVVDATERTAWALARRDCAAAGMDVPDATHELWNVWRDNARAAVSSLLPELREYVRYQEVIRWMTSCSGCAHSLRGLSQATGRAHAAEMTLTELREWAQAHMDTPGGREVHALLCEGDDRARRTPR